MMMLRMVIPITMILLWFLLAFNSLIREKFISHLIFSLFNPNFRCVAFFESFFMKLKILIELIVTEFIDIFYIQLIFVACCIR